MSKSAHQFGKLPARYRFFLNPYADVRFSKCPSCNLAANSRKFPLVIGVDGTLAPIILGLTCRYCPRCELIIAHQNTLEGNLAILFQKTNPEVIGNEYVILSTMDLAYWKRIKDNPPPLSEVLERTADIREYVNYELRYE